MTGLHRGYDWRVPRADETPRPDCVELPASARLLVLHEGTKLRPFTCEAIARSGSMLVACSLRFHTPCSSKNVWIKVNSNAAPRGFWRTRTWNRSTTVAPFRTQRFARRFEFMVSRRRIRRLVAHAPDPRCCLPSSTAALPRAPTSWSSGCSSRSGRRRQETEA